MKGKIIPRAIRKLGLVSTAALALCLEPASAAAGAEARALEAIAGRWEGNLSFRGDTTLIRLEVPRGGTGTPALLDLPELVMAGEPAAISVTSSGIGIEIPFGIGEIVLASGEHGLTGKRDLGGDPLTLDLRRATTPPLIRREMVLRRGEVELRGTLVLPSSAGPHAAVVLVHGSDTPSRGNWSYRSWADALAERGVAALAFDRRGSGASTGDRATDPAFEDLADDALAWVELLHAEPGIRPDGIGIMGGSQGAWVALLAASRSATVAFLILKAAPGGTPSEQEMRSALGRAETDGVGGEEIRALRAYLHLYFFVAATGRGWNLLRAEIERSEGAPWSAYADQPENLMQLDWWRRHGDFAPAGLLPRVMVPVLAVYGTADTVVPPDANAATLEKLIQSGGNGRVTVRIFEGADHRLELPMGRDAEGHWRWPRIAPVFLEMLRPWIDGVPAADGGARPSQGDTTP